MAENETPLQQGPLQASCAGVCGGDNDSARIAYL